MGMINAPHFPEGEIFLRWINNRFDNNKNVIVVTTGPTGSGKSYCDLKKAELQYKKRFNKEFPIENCCFSVSELMQRIQSGDLKRGEVLILEEAGVNAGSGDWQTKVVKMFNYVLQSFRSMNIGLWINLPVLSMLAKQARQLVHMHMETVGIDYELGVCKVKALCHQLNQHTGKSYWKYMRVKANKKIVRVDRLGFSMPSDKLRGKYEAKKQKFLSDMTEEFARELMKIERDKLDKMKRKELRGAMAETYDILQEVIEEDKIIEVKQIKEEIAKRRMKTIRTIERQLQSVYDKGYSVFFLEKGYKSQSKSSQSDR